MISNYTNTLKQVVLTAKEIEEQIKDYPMEFSPIRNTRVEWYTNAPLFLYSFYSSILNDGIVPTQEQYWNNYQKRANEWLEKNGFNDNPRKMMALKARAYRAYPSFVRDIHFAKLLEESGKFPLVFYNETLDALKGVDVVVTKREKQYCIRLHVKTSRSQSWKQKKNAKHDYTDLNEIGISMDFKTAHKCGEFFLYSQEDIIKVENAILRQERKI